MVKIPNIITPDPIELIRHMKKYGSSIELLWSEKDDGWQCDWIPKSILTDLPSIDKLYRGFGNNLWAALLQAFEKARNDN